MEDLLPYYERELLLFRQYCEQFSIRFPGPASRLHMVGKAYVDPHMERMVQSFALLVARLGKRLDDQYPQFTEMLLEVMFPHYLRPFPSCSIVRFDVAASVHANLRAASTIARGTLLESAMVRGGRCTFTTAYDVTVAPLVLTLARFNPVIMAPPSIRLPVATSAGISITFAGSSPHVSPAQLAMGALRLFIDGEPSFCAALRDTLFLRCAAAYLEPADAAGAWIKLDRVPVSAAGFADDDALIPFGARSHPAYRTLTEYFCFPEKYNFVDIDLGALLPLLPSSSTGFTLHLAVTNLRANSDTARILGGLSAGNLLTGCTPVVNLFRQPAVPITLDHASADYTVLADAARAHAFEVYSIDAVHVLRQSASADTVTEFRPFYSLRHGEGSAAQGHYWVARRDEALALRSPGHEKSISFVDVDFQPLALENATVSLELTCSNHSLPGLLNYGRPEGDLAPRGDGSGYPIRFLRKPSAPHRFNAGPNGHWRLISHLTLNHHALVQDGLPALRELLTLYDLPRTPATQRQIRGVTGLAHSPTTAWRRGKHGPSLVHGIEVRLTLDEEAFIGSGMHLFVQVIDRFLGLYVHLNCFTELVILSHNTGEELTRCLPRNGDLNLA